MTSIDNLANEITKQLQTYTTEVEKKVKKAEDKVTREKATELKTHNTFCVFICGVNFF